MATTFAARPMDHILPDNASTYIRTLAKVGTDRMLDLDVDRIRRLWNPATCDIADLPYLAWALSVDIWDPSWPEAQKRIVVANALMDQKRKGTRYTIEKYLGYVGSSIDKIWVPPSRVFAVQALTDDQRAAYVASLPQIRIYPFWNTRIPPAKRKFMRGPAGYSAFMRVTPDDQGQPDPSPASWMQTSAGPLLYGRRATIQTKDGIETPAILDQVTLNGTNTAERITIDYGASKRLFLGHGFFNHGFMQVSRGPANTVTVRVSDVAPLQFAALSGGELQDVRPQRVYEQRQAPKGRAFMGRNFFGQATAFMESSIADRLIYDQFGIVDPSVQINLNPGRSFMGRGYSRFGVKPFHAELRVEVPMNRPRWRFGVGRGQFLTGFIKQTDFTALNNSLTAISQGKSLRDTILVDTEIYATVTLGDGLKLGSFKLGQQIRRT
jgi:phage tail P2-like protein